MRTPDIYDDTKRFIFNNWTSEDFTGSWGGVHTIVKAGDTKELPMSLAYVFTKHLVDRELQKVGKANLLGVDEERAPLEAKTMTEIGEGTDSPALSALKEKIRAEISDNEVKAEAKKKFKVYPSAYANAWLVKTYKARGGGYES